MYIREKTAEVLARPIDLGSISPSITRLADEG